MAQELEPERERRQRDTTVTRESFAVQNGVRAGTGSGGGGAQLVITKKTVKDTLSADPSLRSASILKPASFLPWDTTVTRESFAVQNGVRAGTGSGGGGGGPPVPVKGSQLVITKKTVKDTLSADPSLRSASILKPASFLHRNC
jgi:hypothetical protein